MFKYIKNTHLKKGIAPLLLLSTLTLAGNCDNKPSRGRNKGAPGTGTVNQTPPPTPPGGETGKANPTPPPQKTLSVPGIVPPPETGKANPTPSALLTTQYDTKNMQVIPYIENPILRKLSSHHSPSGITLGPQFLEFNNKWNQSLFLEEQKKQEQLNQKQKKEEKEEEQQQQQQQQYSNSSNAATTARGTGTPGVEKQTEPEEKKENSLININKALQLLMKAFGEELLRYI
ncbi:MAG: hypothetical protein NQ127_04390 [Candidatus Cardinium sp.]|nr:hypothetical protein [Candidatus Cardinium sp.]